MNKPYKPTGYNSASPYFIINNAQKFIDQMTAIFDAKELRRINRPGGTIMHAEIKIDDSVIMLSDATEAYPAMTTVMHVYVPNADNVFIKVIAAGCDII